MLAISGDQTQHLLWRLQRGGELSAEVAGDRSVVFVVMIGTNNLGHGHLPGEAADGVLAVARHLLSNAAGSLVLSTVLPRGDGGAVLPKLCPPRCNASGLPFRSLLPAVSKLNARLGQGGGGPLRRVPGEVPPCHLRRAVPRDRRGGARGGEARPDAGPPPPRRRRQSDTRGVLCRRDPQLLDLRLDQ